MSLIWVEIENPDFMSTQVINQAGIDLIKRWESFRSKPYLCAANVPTIGYGTTVYPNGTRVKMTDKAITEAVATSYLTHYIERKIYPGLNAALKVKLNDNRYSALCSLIYNIGIGAFRRSTLLKVINAAPGAPGIRDEFARWNKAGGKVLRGLVSRRRDEADLYFTTATIGALGVTTARFQRYSALLKIALGSQQEADKAMQLVKNTAAETTFTVDELTESYVKFANRGVKLTKDEMIALADLAASQGKSFDQLTEAILDAQTVDFERLKEFGIRASKSGDEADLYFKV